MNARLLPPASSAPPLKIQELYDELEPKTCNRHKSFVTSDDLSRAMLPFQHEINSLQQLPGIENLELMYELALKVVGCLYRTWMGNACRPLGILVGAPLVRIAKARRNADQVLDVNDTMHRPKDEG
jgi:hypothetical protein